MNYEGFFYDLWKVAVRQIEIDYDRSLSPMEQWLKVCESLLQKIEQDGELLIVVGAEDLPERSIDRFGPFTLGLLIGNYCAWNQSIRLFDLKHPPQ